MYASGPRELQTEGVEAESFEALADVAISKLHAAGQNVGVVCGPITTGGTGNQTYNFEIFNAVIRGLERLGKPLFNQVPYEFGLRRLSFAWEAAGNSGYCMPILEIFYGRVFSSGYITRGYFIPGWQSSFGARWEREEFRSRGIPVTDLTREDIRQFMRQEYDPEHVGKVMALLER